MKIESMSKALVAVWIALTAAAVGAQNVTATAQAGVGAGPARVEQTRSLATELVATGLANPTLALAPPGDLERIFVLEQAGTIRIIKAGAVLVSPFLDLSALVTGVGEQGLLGLAFHPDYNQNGRFYVTYNDLLGNWVLASYTASPPNSDTALIGSGNILLTIPKPFPQHNGGMLAFGPDRLLYASTGDGGAGNDPFNNAQDTGSLLGKILRLDVINATPYGIPEGNPFLGVPGAAPEVWAYGLRNPWRFSIDPLTGDLWIGDVGQESREEVDFLPFGVGGLNFGWSCMEGTLCTGLPTCACNAPSLRAPIYEFTHNVGCSVTGGVVYRGGLIPEVAGRYFFADYCTGQVWSLRQEQGVGVDLIDHTTALDPPLGSLSLLTALGTDGAGELLFVTYGGRIYRMVVEEPNPDCDGDGEFDTFELAQGTQFDLNQDGKPDECQLLLSVSDGLVIGQQAQLEFLGAQAGQKVNFFYSWRGISIGGTVFDGNLELDLSPVNVNGTQGFPLAGIAVADSQGRAVLDWTVESAVFSGVLSFQAGINLGPDSVKSNPVQKLVAPN